MQTKHMVAGNLPKEAEAEEKKKTLRIFKGKIRPKKMLKIIKISKKHAKTWGTRFGVMSAVMDFLPVTDLIKLQATTKRCYEKIVP